MKKYTKLCLATLCFIASTAVLADGYKGEAPPLVPVSIPMFDGGFEFTLGAIYMNPDSSNLNYLGLLHAQDAGVNDINNHMDYAVDPDYAWGFMLGLGYVIPGTANDVKLDWMYFHNDFDSSENIVGTTDTAVFFPTDGADLGGATTLNASAQADYKFDAVDLTFGQYLNFGSRLQTRLFAGLRYMRLDDDLSTSYLAAEVRSPSTSTTPITLEGSTGEINSSFNGLGTLVGFKADYYLGAGFSVSGGIDGALLVGQVSLDANNYDAVFTQDTATSPFVLATASAFDYGWNTQNVIAPGYDAKFGFDYKYQFNNGTLLGVELGYQVTKYIDVVGEIDRESLDDRFDEDLTNFRLAGPYLTVNVKV